MSEPTQTPAPAPANKVLDLEARLEMLEAANRRLEAELAEAAAKLAQRAAEDAVAGQHWPALPAYLEAPYAKLANAWDCRGQSGYIIVTFTVQELAGEKGTPQNAWSRASRLAGLVAGVVFLGQERQTGACRLALFGKPLTPAEAAAEAARRAAMAAPRPNLS